MTPFLIVAAVMGFLVATPILLARYLPAGRSGRRIQVVLRILAPVVAVLPVLIGLLQYAANQRTQTDNATRSEYIQATQLIWETSETRQLAGIAAIAQLAADDSLRTWLMTESLSAFIRFHTPREATRSDRAPIEDAPCDDVERSPFAYAPCVARAKLLGRPTPAVQAALAAIGTRIRRNESISISPVLRWLGIDGVPTRFREAYDAANSRVSGRYVSYRTNVTTYINKNWHRVDRRQLDRRALLTTQQLIDEVNIGHGANSDRIQIRPWLNLSHAELKGAEADAAWLEGGDLRDTNLILSRFSGARLAKADFSNSWLVGAQFFGADLRGVGFRLVDARGASFGQANLREAWIAGSDLSRANFWQAELEGAYLIASKLIEVETMSGSNLNRAVGYRADFTGANIAGDGEYEVCMQDAYLKEAKFTGAVLAGVDLQRSELHDAQMQKANMRAVKLREAKLDGAELDGADLSLADLRDTDLSSTKGTPLSVAGALVNNVTKFPAAWPSGLRASMLDSPPSADNSRQCLASSPWRNVRGLPRSIEQRRAILGDAQQQPGP